MPERTITINRVKPQRWMAKDMAKFAQEPTHRINAWKQCGVLNNESSFTEGFLALLAHELRKHEIMRLTGSTARIAGILAAVRSILCVVDLDAALKAPDPMEIFVANIRGGARQFTLETEAEVLDWNASMKDALQALTRLAQAIDNVGECWIYITQDETGRDQVCILDGDPDGGPDRSPSGHVLISQHAPRFAPVTVALNIRELLCDARGRMN